nr:hypothetical protein GCM10020241_31730 [Streptoalloteichus tenebrarius]
MSYDRTFNDVDHRTIHAWLHTGPGSAATTTAMAERWRAVGARFMEVAALVDQAIAAAGGVWTGPAARTAADGMSPLAGYGRSAADAAERIAVCLARQSAFFDEVRHGVPDVVAGPVTPLHRSATPWSEDVAGVEDACRAADEEARRRMRVYQANSARNVADLLGYQPPPGRMAVGDHAPSGPFDGGSGTPAIVSAAFGASSVGGEADQPDGAGRLAGGGGRPSEIRTPDSGGGGDASVVGGALTAPDQVMSSESVSGEPGVVAGVGIGGVGDAVAGDRPEGRLEGRSAEFGGSSVGGEADQPGGADRLAGGGGWPTEVRTRDSGGGEATGVDDAAEVPGPGLPSAWCPHLARPRRTPCTHCPR